MVAKVGDVGDSRSHDTVRKNYILNVGFTVIVLDSTET
jgi:hypothetical protein